MYPKYDESFPGLNRVRAFHKKYKIYVLIDPRDNTVHYVGQTKNTHRRKNQHYEAGLEWNKLLRAWKYELQTYGVRLEFKVIDSVETSYEMEKVEDLYKDYYFSFGFITNIAYNSRTVKSHKQTEHTKRCERAHLAAVARKTAAKKSVNAFLNTRNSFDEIKPLNSILTSKKS